MPTTCQSRERKRDLDDVERWWSNEILERVREAESKRKSLREFESERVREADDIESKRDV